MPDTTHRFKAARGPIDRATVATFATIAVALGLAPAWGREAARGPAQPTAQPFESFLEMDEPGGTPVFPAGFDADIVLAQKVQDPAIETVDEMDTRRPPARHRGR